MVDIGINHRPPIQNRTSATNSEQSSNTKSSAVKRAVSSNPSGSYTSVKAPPLDPSLIPMLAEAGAEAASGGEIGRQAEDALVTDGAEQVSDGIADLKKKMRKDSTEGPSQSENRYIKRQGHAILKTIREEAIVLAGKGEELTSDQLAKLIEKNAMVLAQRLPKLDLLDKSGSISPKYREAIIKEAENRLKDPKIFSSVWTRMGYSALRLAMNVAGIIPGVGTIMGGIAIADQVGSLTRKASHGFDGITVSDSVSGTKGASWFTRVKEGLKSGVGILASIIEMIPGIGSIPAAAKVLSDVISLGGDIADAASDAMVPRDIIA